MKNFICFLIFTLISLNIIAQNWEEFTIFDSPEGFLPYTFGWSIDSDGDVAIVGVSPLYEGDGDVDYGGAVILNYNGTNWIKTQELVPADGVVTDKGYGFNVAIDNNIAMVSAEGDNSFTGAVYVFEFDGENWNETQKLVPQDASPNLVFGTNISIDGNTVAISSEESNGSGAVYIYNYNGTDWIEEEKITKESPLSGDVFGISANLTNDQLIVGCGGEDGPTGSFHGAVYIYRFDGTSWQLEQRLFEEDLLPTMGGLGAFYGRRVLIDGATAIVGAPSEDDERGAVYIYQLNLAGIWEKTQRLTVPEEYSLEFNFYGFALSKYEDQLCIGSHGEHLGEGAAYLFNFNGEQWIEQERIKPDVLPNPGTSGDNFSYSISLGENWLFFGAPWRDLGNSVGSIYIYSPRQVGVSTSHIEAISNLFVFPNPTEGDFVIDLEGAFYYELESISGSKVASGFAKDRKELSLHNYASGAYLITVIQEGKSTTLKLINK